MNIYNYSAPPGRRDQLISPPLNLAGYDQAYLLFEHAYALKYPSLSDSLIIYLSSDCGGSWTRIFAGGDNGEGSFATHELTTDEFIPQGAGDWCMGDFGPNCFTVDISEWTGMANIKIMFESYHYLGNNLFLDNIVVTPYVGNDALSISGEIEVYPNPTSGLFNVIIGDSNSYEELLILDIRGRQILSESLATKSGQKGMVQVDLSGYPKGIYLIRIINLNRSETLKIIKQ
jgi:hypothetical protein